MRGTAAGSGVPETSSRAVCWAMISGALPFAVWNLKGYLDTIPEELEEAAAIDGADPNQVFFRVVLPLAAPQLAVTFFLGFIGLCLVLNTLFVSHRRSGVQ